MKTLHPVVRSGWLILILALQSSHAQVHETDFGLSLPGTLYDFSVHWTPGSSTHTYQADDLLRFLDGTTLTPEISPNVRVLGGDPELIDFSEGRLVFAIPAGASPSFEVGDIILGNPTNPYLAKVRNYAIQGGAAVVETGTTTLSEVVRRGYLRTSLLFAPGHAKGFSLPWDKGFDEEGPHRLEWTGVRTLDLENLGARVEGSFHLDPRIELEIFLDEGIEFFRAELVGEASFDLTFEISTDLLRIDANEIFPIEWEASRWEQAFVQSIGDFPIWEEVTVRLMVGIDLEGDARGEVRTSASSIASINLGGEFDRGLAGPDRWRAIERFDSEVGWEQPIVSLEGELMGRFHVRPEIEVKFFSAPGPTFELRHDIDFDGYGSPPPHTFCEWEVQRAVHSALDFDLSALDDTVGPWSRVRRLSREPVETGECENVSPIAPETIEIPSGTFTMGRRDDGDDGSGGPDEVPRHSVPLSRYRIGKFEVTNAEYVEVLNWALKRGLLRGSVGEPYVQGDVYSHGRLLLRVDSAGGPIRMSAGLLTVAEREGKPLADHPLANVTWHGAVAYCNWLSEIEGLTPCYTLWTGEWILSDRFGGGYRLPTEAEWERAAAWDGSKRWIYGFESDTLTGRNRCNYWDGSNYVNPLGFSSPPYTSPVGWFNGVNVSPNGAVQTLLSRSPVGCFDMSGNVMEWCEDWYLSTFYSTPASRERDPLCETAISGRRVVRGGSWQNTFLPCRSADRERPLPETSDDSLGFRIVRSEPETTSSAEMVTLPPGAFLMGNPGGARDEACWCSGCDCEEPVRTVRIDYSLRIGKYEVSNHQYAEALNWAREQGLLDNAEGGPHVSGDVYYNGRPLIDVTSLYADLRFMDGEFQPRNRGGVSMDNHPVKRVTWFGAAAFCNWASMREGTTPVYDLETWSRINRQADGYRLPSEAEWEYACRGSTTNPNRYAPYSFGDDPNLQLSGCDFSPILDSHLVWCGNTNGWTEPIGSRAPNDLGLHDLHGNVWEWCEDGWHESYAGAGRPDDGRAWETSVGGARVIRGGSWNDPAGNCRSASRLFNPPEVRISTVGFRVARTP